MSAHFTSGRESGRPVGILVSLLIFGAGCGQSAEDRATEAGIKTVAVHRSAHPHYPIMVVEDFGPDSQPVGIALDAYGFYVHEMTKVNPRASVLSQTAAAERLELAFERSIQSVQSAESGTPPPKPPYPKNLDWAHALHPKSGTYTIVSRCGPVARSFDVELPKPTSGPPPTPATLRAVLSHDASLVVGGGLKDQESALAALKPPGGFSLCTNELLAVQQGSRAVQMHMSGGPLLLTPIDKTLVLKALGHTVRKLLDLTRKLSPPPPLAHLTVDGPNFNETYPIPLDGLAAETKGVDAALSSLGEKIEELNKSAR